MNPLHMTKLKMHNPKINYLSLWPATAWLYSWSYTKGLATELELHLYPVGLNMTAPQFLSPAKRHVMESELPAWISGRTFQLSRFHLYLPQDSACT